jgi:hypothetical protein
MTHFLFMFYRNLQYWLNEYTNNIGIGVYHSGVEVSLLSFNIASQTASLSHQFQIHNTEFAYGGKN